MIKLNPRKIIQYEASQLWDMLTGEFILVMDDGEIETNYKEVIFSRYCWKVHELFPNLPFLKTHLVSSVMKDGTIDVRSHNRLMSNINVTLLEVYNIVDPMQMWDLAKMYYEITNDIYNGFITHIGEYVNGMDILDFIEVCEHKEIAEARSNVQPSPESIEQTYRVIIDEIKNNPALAHNPIVHSVKAQLVKMNNLKQCIGPRGYLNDISGDIFKNPILTGYVEGFKGLYESLIESRSASRALFFSKGQLEDTEYFSRRLQLQTMVLERIHVGDCGSNKFIHWTIKDKKELALMTGAYYQNADNQLVDIKITDEHLVGKSIKIRSMIAGCYHPDPHGVCSVCAGKMYINMLSDTNIGHNSSTTTTKNVSQGVISTKHFEESSTGEGIEFTGKVLNFLATKPKTLDVYLKPISYHKNFNLHLAINESGGLSDLEDIDDINSLNASRLTNITVISIEYDTQTEIHNFPIDMIQTSRRPFFTKEFLSYIKEKGFSISHTNTCIIDLKDWDMKLPVFRYPMKHYNMGEHGQNIANLIESTMNEIEERIKPDSAVELLNSLFDLVNSKLSVHFSVLSLVVYAAMIRALETSDYRLPKGDTPQSLSVISLILANRSMSAELAYENQYEAIKNPRSFFSENRIDHVMDVFIRPHEVAKYRGWY